jgi:cytoskeletal protein CcmA (bactofilin family)
MAISNFRIPTGLEVSGTTTITGTVDVTSNLQVGGTASISGTLNFIQESRIVSVPSSSGDGLDASTLQFIPDKDLIANDQYVVVDPTAPSHIHLRAGGAIDASNAYLYLGGEKANVQVTNQTLLQNVKIHSSGTLSSYEWTFGNDGVLTLAGDISGSRGDYTSLYINGVPVAAGGIGASDVSGAITGALASYDSNVSGAITSSLTGYATLVGVSGTFATYAEVSGAITGALTNIPTRSEVSGVLTASYAQLAVNNIFTTDQTITGGLSMTADLSARSASLSGDLTVQGKLTVNTMVYADSTTVNIGDTNINLGTGSTLLSALDGGGLDLGTSAQVQWRYSSGSAAWKSNVAVNVSSAVPSYKLNDTNVLTRVAGANALVNSTFGSVSITSTSVTTLSGALTASVIAPLVTIGSPLVTSASLNAATAVTVGNVSTQATTINGATTTVVGVNGLILSGANVYVTGATYHDSNVSGTTAQFTLITGSTVTGSTALFTIISGSQLTASTSLTAPTLVANVLVASATNALNIAGGGTGSVDVFASANYSAAKYVIKANDNTTSEVHVLEALVATDGTAALLTPYASTYTGASALITLSSSYGGGNVTVSALNNSANQVTVKFLKSYIA